MLQGSYFNCYFYRKLSFRDAKWNSSKVTWLLTALRCDNKSTKQSLFILTAFMLLTTSLSVPSPSLSVPSGLCSDWLNGFHYFEVTYQKIARCFLCNNWFSLYSCNLILLGFNKVNECFNQDFLQDLICFLKKSHFGTDCSIWFWNTIIVWGRMTLAYN